ncbi:MAG TPA: ABC transporter permease subunit [Gemmatimonadales bacterium]|nr:ABC transporter permease subunit [Gemmatimonadales bacterium]
MIRVIARKELLDQVSSPKFVFLFAVSALLIVFSLYTGSAAYVGAREEHNSTETLARRELENRQDYNELSQFGVKVSRPPSPLSSVAGGVSSALGRSARVRPGQQPEIAPPPVADTPVIAVLGELDLSVVTRVFLSLFVLLLTYDAVAGEKERGTLKAVLANPVPRAQLLMGKTVGLFSVFLAAAAIPAIIGALIMTLGFGIELSGGDWARLAAMGVVGVLYLLALFSTGLFVSTVTTRSSVAFLVLLLILVGFVEVIPKASPMLARQFRPAASFAELQSERDRLLRENQQAMMRSFQGAFGLLAAAPPDDEGARAVLQARIDSTIARARDSLQRELREQTARLEEGYRNRQEAMTGLALAFSRASPAAAMSHATEVLAGTDFDLHKRWRDELVAYRGALEEWLKAKGVEFGGGMRFAVRVNTGGAGGGGGAFHIGSSGSEDTRLDLTTLPQFTARAESLGVALGRAAPDLVILGVWSAVTLLLAFWRFLRYDVR